MLTKILFPFIFGILNDERMEQFLSNLVVADCHFAVGATLSIPLSFVLVIYALLLTGTTLLLASSAKNLDQLGLRPHGRNLWEWWLSYNVDAKNGASGIPGYDPILGSFDPSSRAAFHVASMLGFWGLALQIGSFLDEIKYVHDVHLIFSYLFFIDPQILPKS